MRDWKLCAAPTPSRKSGLVNFSLGALAWLGHPVLGGGLGAFGVTVGLILGSDRQSLERKIRQRMSGRAACLEVLEPKLLSVAWPELWSDDQPLPPALSNPSLLRELLLPLAKSLRMPICATRPTMTPRILRSQLLHQPNTVLDRLQTWTPETPAGWMTQDSVQIPVLMDRGGKTVAGLCNHSLLSSFGLNYEPFLAQEPIGTALESP